MDKPFIGICNAPYSYTSKVSKFLNYSGAYTNDVWDNKWELSHSRFEEEELQKYVELRKNFKNYGISSYFAFLPEDKIKMVKVPLSIFLLMNIINEN